VLLSATLAWAQPVPAGRQLGTGTQVEARLGGQNLAGRVGWEVVAGKRELVARLGEWSDRGTRVGPGRYVFKLQRRRAKQRGVAGVLRGSTASGEHTETMELLVDRSQGFRAALRQDGKVLARVRRPAPVVTGEPPELLRRTWWGSLPVAAWGTAVTAFEFFKPGSRGFEEMRGETTPEDSRALRQALEDFTPKPWGPAEIYRAARELSLSDYLALQLAFGFSLDERWEMRELIGIDSKEPLHDKYNHYFASAVMAHRANAPGSFFVGWAKEVGDIPGTGYSEPDLVADALGAEFGESLAAGRVLDHARSLPNPR